MCRDMKESNISWVGMIPETWEVKRGKAILKYLERPVKEDDGVITCFRDGMVTLRSNRREDGFTVSFQETGYQGVEYGDLVVHGMDGFAGAIGISDSRGKATPVLNVLDSTENKRFLMYYLRNMAYNGVFLALSTGIRVRSCDTNWNKLKNLPYIIPPKFEQDRIVSFLDEKCAEIDSAIERTRKSIEEYKRLRQAIITDAVTGTKTASNTKDSGIDWIGIIASDRDVCRMKFLLSEGLQYGANATGTDYSEELPRYIRITDITSDGKLKGTGKLSLPTEEAIPYMLENGDLLFARSGGTVGKSFLYRSEYGSSAFAGYLIRARFKQTVLPEYMFYYTNSSIYETWKNSIFIQATIQNIGADRYANLPVVIPSTFDEQKAIVDCLNKDCIEIDSIIGGKEETIEQLNQYKKSLIYEYVTGKKEVPWDN